MRYVVFYPLCAQNIGSDITQISSRALKVALPVVGPQLHHDYHFETFKFRLDGEHTKAMSEVKRSSVNSLTTHIDIIYLSPYIAIQHNLPILRHNDQLYSRQSSLVRRTR